MIKFIRCSSLIICFVTIMTLYIVEQTHDSDILKSVGMNRRMANKVKYRRPENFTPIHAMRFGMNFLFINK